MNYTLQEKLLYTFLICAIMEFSMAYYNYFFHTDAFLHEAFLLAALEFLPAFLIGFICEWYLVSRIAKRIAKALHRERFKDKSIILINEAFIALGMVIIISIYGAILHNDGTHEFWMTLMVNFLKNILFGIPFFLIVVGPSARKLVGMYRHHRIVH